MAFNEQTAPIEVLAAAARTSGVTSSNIDRNNFGRAQAFNFLLSCGAASGTTPTLNIQIQDSDDGSTGWANVSGGAFTQTTAAAFKEITVKSTRRFLRAVVTIGGTTPSFTFSLVCVAGDPLDASI